MVDVKVEFEHNGQTWAHEFNIRKGTLVKKLKLLMLAPNGSEEDANKFDLKLKGRRMPNYVEIKRPTTLQFDWLGKEEGTWRANEDEAKVNEGDTYWESDEEEAKAWTVYTNYDLLGKGDIESMEVTDVKAVKSKVEQFGYSGFSLWRGMAYMKKLPRQLTKKDLEFKGKDSGVTFYIYNPEPVYVFKEDKAPPPQGPPQHQAAPPAHHQPPPQAHHQAAPQPQPKAEPPKPQAPPKPAASLVSVTVKHAVAEMASEVTVEVMSDCTVLDVRRAVMAALGEAKLSEVKLVKKAGKSFTSLSGDEPLGARREFLSMGRRLGAPGGQAPAAAPKAPEPQAAPAPAPAPAAPPQPPVELDITVTIDRALGFTVPLKVMKHSSVWSVKQQLADMDPTGNAKPTDWHLGITAKVEGHQPKMVPDDAPITEEHLELDLVPKE
mmetsp:Transcript_57398/g.168060  ORF Transcript_57398/g.168060 Transcript_57398/m.168060 type:complete len:436 (+) Transcript_57398:62-1369(+)